MKSNLTKVLALMMAIAIVFSLGACGKDEGETTTAAADTTTAVGDTTAASETTTAVGETTTVGETTAAVGETTTLAGKPETPDQILAAYTEVMNKAKTEKPAYQKKEYQALPKDERDFQKGGNLVNFMLGLAGLFMDEEDKASVEQHKKGDETKWFPVYEATKGCLLTDASAIKTAKCDELADGNYKILIVLKDEINPEPYDVKTGKSPSNTGKMFSPLARASIDDTLINDSAVNKFIKNTTYELKYYDCTAELVYNPKTKQISTLNQYMSVKINIMDPTKVTGFSVVGWAVLDNTLKIWGFSY